MIEIPPVPGLDRLNPREQRLVLGLAASVVVVLLASVLNAIVSDVREKQVLITTGGREVAEMQELRAEYLGLQAEVNALLARPAAPSVAQAVEGVTTRMKLGERVASIRNHTTPRSHPRFAERAVQVQLEDLGLEPLVEFMVAVRRDRYLLQIRRMKADARGEPGDRVFEANVQVSTFEENPT